MTNTNEAGANPGEAKGYGTKTISIAENFSGISGRFLDVCLDVEEDSGTGKLKLTGFDAFGQECKSSMDDVQEHGTQMGGNMVSGAESTEATDRESMSEFERSAVNVPGNDVPPGHGPWAPTY
ncbi:hypothetical protein [Nocardiopsis halophila]|uniref:hypothetical protein n=1 Tax=Nocardiopsis halophila TaxID=141692 RepID=UPI001267E8FD|nr:hypothetical protein [Nocardiopsis halophila]